MPNPVFYRVIEKGVQKIHATDNKKFADSFLRMARTESKDEAPKRSTKLRNGIQIKLATPSGYLTHEGRVTSTAGHSLYVHEGTAGPIRPKNSRLMRVPKDRLSKVRGAMLPNSLILGKEGVRGQSANPFLVRGMIKAMAKHPKVRTITRGRI